MSLALFDVLTNKIDNEIIEMIHPDKYLYLSIRNHLTRLLNTRQNSLTHLPDYGLPDLIEIYKGLPYSVNELLISIKYTVEKYEPRLKNIIVQPIVCKEKESVLQLKIYGKILNSSEGMQFIAYFLSDGQVQIK